MTGINRSRHKLLREYVDELVAGSEGTNETASLKSELALLDHLFDNYCNAMTGLTHLIGQYENLHKKVRVHARALRETNRRK
ncbi:MAG: hypothetical protein J7539_13670 [Niabella sp.]|nr:hypothetical protein [Niabella sp.]